MLWFIIFSLLFYYTHIAFLRVVVLSLLWRKIFFVANIALEYILEKVHRIFSFWWWIFYCLRLWLILSFWLVIIFEESGCLIACLLRGLGIIFNLLMIFQAAIYFGVILSWYAIVWIKFLRLIFTFFIVLTEFRILKWRRKVIQNIIGILLIDNL